MLIIWIWNYEIRKFLAGTKNMYGTVQELRSTVSHIKSINIDFSLIWFVSLCVDL